MEGEKIGERDGNNKPKLTPANDLALDIPFADHGEEESHSIDNWNGEAEFYE